MIYTDKIIQLYESADLNELWSVESLGVSTYFYGNVGSGLEITFQTYIENEVVKASRYKVFGCGYSIALCVWLATHLESKNRSVLENMDLANLIEVFDLPKTKYKCAIAVLNIYQQILA